MKNSIITTWEHNAEHWIRLMQDHSIPTRTFTNNAIVSTIKELLVKNVLDVGCGEGWLTRNLVQLGKTATGIDGTATLIKYAKTQGTEPYYHLSYEQIINGVELKGAPFDALVFNFSIYQEEEVVLLFKALKKHLSSKGFLVIQTLHPSFLLLKNLPYKSQWISSAWSGLPGNIKYDHSWYARTYEDWIFLFLKTSYTLHSLKEVVDNREQPISMIYILKKNNESI